MSRKIKINGQLVDFETLVSRDNDYKNKIWRYRKDGEVEAVDSTSLTDDDIVFSGSKSNLRRLADIERNVSILSTKVLTTTNTSSYDVFDDNFGSIFDQDVRFKGEVRIDSTPTSATDAVTKGYVDTAISNVSVDLTGYATETFVNTAVSNLVDAAPTTLDTLNELAAALGDDPNFATTVTNAIGDKANSADLATVATSGTYSDLTGAPTIPSDISELADSTGLLDSGASVTYGATAPTDAETGSLWFDTTDGELYVYNGSSWVSTAPTVTVDLSTSSITEFSDVDTITTAPTDGQALIWDATNSKFVPGESFSETDVANYLSTNNYATISDIPTATSELTNDSGFITGYTVTESDVTAHQAALAINESQITFTSTFATETYVDTAISNLVDTAPTTLDTLNELAAALGDDPNFATTITNSLANKADISSVPTDVSDLTDATNLLDHFSGAYADLTGAPTIPADVSDLTDTTNLLVHYTDSDAISAITSADLDMGTNKILYANMYPTEGDLPDASTYHGMFAHVHGTGRGYFAHAGSWTALANQSELFSGSYNDLTNKPTIPADVSDLTDTTNLLDHFSGAYTDLTGAPTIPTDISDLTDNNSLLSSGGGGASVEYGSTAPSSPSQGDLWFDTSVGTLYVYDGSAWITTASAVGGGSGGGASLEVGDTAPESPDAGALWFKTDSLDLYVYYSDNWVQIGGGAGGGSSSGGGASLEVSATAPENPEAGDMWYDSTYGVLLVRLETGWVTVGGSGGGGTTINGLNDIDDVDLTTNAPTVGQTLVWDGTNWVPGAAAPKWEATNANKTLVAADHVLVDTTTAAITLTLPASPELGDEIRIIDGAGSAATNNITINRNGNNIEGAAEDLVIDVNRAAFGLVYYNATQGWLFMEK